MRWVPLLMLLAAPLAAPAAEAPPSTDGLVELLRYTGVETDDLARPADDRWTPWAATVAGAPLTLEAALRDESERRLAAAPADSLRWAAEQLFHGAQPPVVPRPAAPWPPADATRAERKLLRSLDPALVEVLVELLALIRGASAAPGQAAPAELLARAAEADGESGESDALAVTLAAALPPARLHHWLAAGEAGIDAALAAERSLAAGVSRWPERALAVETDVGRIWIGTPGPDRFDAPFTLVLDPGGHDVYDGDAHPRPLTMIVDAGGDDVYRGAPVAFDGVAILLDGGGDDDYRGGAASLGGALGGCGVLLDRAGHDRYDGGGWSAGGAALGTGVLLDGAGDDQLRTAGPASQGAAGPAGVGLLVDWGGDDDRRAHGVLAQGAASGASAPLGGGIGLLVDGGGDDGYRAVDRAQGWGHAGGLGALVDRGGDDLRSARRAAQGAADDGGIGALLDLSGDDLDDLRAHGQGYAGAGALAALIDRAGDDLHAGGVWVQGAAHDGGVAWLLDGAGDDDHLARDPRRRWGWAAPPTAAALGEQGAVALHLDAAGDDRFAGDEAGSRDDGDADRPAHHGVAVDQRDPPSLDHRPRAARTAPVPAGPHDVVALLTEAQGEDTHGTDAIARLVAGGAALYPALRDAAIARPALAGLAVEVLAEVARREPDAPATLAAQLGRELAPATAGAGAPEHAGWLLEVYLAIGGDDPAIPAAHLADPRPSVRARAAAALATPTSDGQAAAAALGAALDDPAAEVRAAAARALGPWGRHTDRAALAARLTDPSLAVRDAAAHALVTQARDGWGADVLLQIRPPALAGSVAALAVLARVPDRVGAPGLELLLGHDDAGVRGHAALALGAVGDRVARKALLGREAVEADPFVLWCLDRALRTPGNAAAIVPELP